ncbi:MAG: preprotein translocase subunit YajC [Nitrosomonas sp. PRO4]|nr:preprotein translocase subunit YajC [Nitrosomonas sp. PRO4]
MLISDAFAQAAAPAQSDASLISLLPMVGIFILFYLLLIRPQSKRAKEHKQMVEALQRGDEVITNGGILGVIINVSESYVIVEIAPAIEVTVLKSSVQTLLPKGTLKSIEPRGGKTQKNKIAKPSPVETNQPEETSKVAENTDTESEKDIEKK